MPAMRDLEIRHMVALDAVATEGTFGRAASRLGYTQSAVSQQIAALERLVGAPLFDRPGGPRPVELTPLGELVLAHARDVLARVEVAADDIDRFRAGAVGRIDVGTFQSISTALLPTILGRLRTERPDVGVRLYESDFEDELIARLAAGELDVSFAVGSFDPHVYESEVLLADPFVLLAPLGEFADSTVRIADLAGRQMIGQQENSCQRLNEAGLRAGGIEPDYVFRTNDNGAVAAMVRAGMGVAVLPRLCVERDDPRVSLHDLEPRIPDRIISIMWRRNRALSPAAERFIGLAREVCADIAHADRSLSV
jgi:DNA-binding transcriptional LysR family regulator